MDSKCPDDTAHVQDNVNILRMLEGTFSLNAANKWPRKLGHIVFTLSILGPLVQSIVSLMSSLVVKMLSSKYNI